MDDHDIQLDMNTGFWFVFITGLMKNPIILFRLLRGEKKKKQDKHKGDFIYGIIREEMMTGH